jgi:hypothetical protein
MVGIGVAMSLAPVFAIANLSTAKVELDAISQSLVDADAFITNLMPTTVPSTIPTSSVAGQTTTSTVAPTTVPAERIDILAIGDSVMLGAAPEMTKYGVTVDAQKSRPFKAALPIVNYVKSINALGSAVVIHLGTNSGTSQETIDSIVSVLTDVPLVLVLTNSVPGKDWEASNNRLIRALPERYPNVQILDWKKYATDHPKWLYDDLTHLRPMGQRKYTALIMEALGRPGPQFEDAVLTAPAQATTTTSSTPASSSTTTSFVAPRATTTSVK